MNSSHNARTGLLPVDSALQHEHAPRPLPLFLGLLREVSRNDPILAQEALAGLKAYQRAPRDPPRPIAPEILRVGGASLRDHGGTGPPAILIPSLINPPSILDLDEDVSLTAAVSASGRRALLLDWGKASDRSQLSITKHVETLLLPLLGDLGEPAALIGYCLGGTMAVAAANLGACERVITLAAPWNFSRYPEDSRNAVRDMWRHAQTAARQLGALPMEVLQAAFWSLDPVRTVTKFADFGRLDPASGNARRFVELEEWANEGEPLPFAAAQELIEDFFGKDSPGSNSWHVEGRRVSDQLQVPAFHFTAARDVIAPSATAPSGETVDLDAGHVGMIVGSARDQLHDALARVLDPACRSTS